MYLISEGMKKWKILSSNKRVLDSHSLYWEGEWKTRESYE